MKEGIDDLIAAISTPQGAGGIGIVRMSGCGAVAVADKVFMSHKNKKLSEQRSHTLTVGNLIDPTTRQVVDEVIVSIMKAPNSYTKEDVVEINCHGGTLAVKRTLALLLKNGARLAAPGEFTKRAFLNGRLDLSQAEAVVDLIHAKTDIHLQTAAAQLEGRLAKEVKAMRQRLLDMIAGIEAAIDYPEYDVEEESRNELLLQSQELKKELEKLLKNADRGKILRDGLETVIIGKPNVGKSSLLNWFLEEDRAIVTEMEGTTRDTVEEYFNLDGIPIKMVDTAGIRETSDVVEKIGVEKSKRFAAKADLLLLLLDGSRPLSQEDFDVLKLAEGKRALILVNKSDLPLVADISSLAIEQTLPVSVKQNTGLEQLAGKLKDMFFEGANINSETAMLGNVRHQDALYHALESLQRAIAAIEGQMPEDFISMDLQQANDYLGEISGDTVDEEIIDRIFTRFCLGK